MLYLHRDRPGKADPTLHFDPPGARVAYTCPYGDTNSAIGDRWLIENDALGNSSGRLTVDGVEQPTSPDTITHQRPSVAATPFHVELFTLVGIDLSTFLDNPTDSVAKALEDATENLVQQKLRARGRLIEDYFNQVDRTPLFAIEQVHTATAALSYPEPGTIKTFDPDNITWDTEAQLGLVVFTLLSMALADKRPHGTWTETTWEITPRIPPEPPPTERLAYDAQSALALSLPERNVEPTSFEVMLQHAEAEHRVWNTSDPKTLRLGFADLHTGRRYSTRVTAIKQAGLWNTIADLMPPTMNEYQQYAHRR